MYGVFIVFPYFAGYKCGSNKIVPDALTPTRNQKSQRLCDVYLVLDELLKGVHRI